jgi:hypothetical protein
MENFSANRRALLLSLTTLLVVVGIYLLQPRPITAQDQQVQVVELKAKKYEFVPSPVHVKAPAQDYSRRPRSWFQDRNRSQRYPIDR